MRLAVLDDTLIAADADPRVAADFASRDTIRGGLGQGPKDSIGYAKARQPPGCHWARRQGIDDGPFWGNDRERTKVAAVVRHIIAHQTSHTGIGGRLGEGEGTVDAPFDLRC